MERRTVLRAAGVIAASRLVRVRAHRRMRRVGMRSGNPRPSALKPGAVATVTATTIPRRGTSTFWVRVIRLAAAVSVLTAVSVAHSQPGGSVPRVGYLSPYSASDSQIKHGRDLFLQALRELGYVEGQNVAVEYRWAEGKDERLQSLAAELVHSAVDVIVATGGVPSARAAQQATRTIPIVIGGAVDPVGAGLVASFARPGGNITGMTLIPEALVSKQLELLREVVPKASRVAVLWNPDNPGNARQLRAAAAVSGIRVEPVGARSSAEIDKAFVTMAQQRPDGFVVLLDPFFVVERERIADLAIRNRLPGVYGFRIHAEDRGLMAYGASRVELANQTAYYVARILKGTKPTDLPVAQPTKFELVINMRTAKALGLKIPQSVLLRADEIIER
jgi:putative ABC transport system substrate-binding protein